jgi:hypothetical protein
MISRYNLIEKVWDLSLDKLNAIHTVTHSENVASIKWRPKRRTQITACSNSFDAHLYVWDLKRPYVPYASFDMVTNKVQSIDHFLILTFLHISLKLLAIFVRIKKIFYGAIVQRC